MGLSYDVLGRRTRQGGKVTQAKSGRGRRKKYLKRFPASKWGGKREESERKGGKWMFLEAKREAKF